MLAKWYFFIGMFICSAAVVSAKDNDKTLHANGVSDSVEMKRWDDTVTRASELIEMSAAIVDSDEHRSYLVNADSLLSKAIKVYPDNIRALLLQGNARYQLTKKAEDAMPLYLKTLIINPSYYEGNFNMGAVLMEDGKPQEAIPYIRAALASQPDALAASYNLADCYYKTGNGDSAIIIYKDIATRQPQNALPIYKIGATYGRVLRNLDECVQFMSKAVEMDPKVDFYKEDLIVAYGLKKDYNNVIKLCQQGIKMNPSYAAYYYDLGTTYFILGKKRKAKKDFKKASQLNPTRYPLE